MSHSSRWVRTWVWGGFKVKLIYVYLYSLLPQQRSLRAPARALYVNEMAAAASNSRAVKPSRKHLSFQSNNTKYIYISISCHSAVNWMNKNTQNVAALQIKDEGWAKSAMAHFHCSVLPPIFGSPHRGRGRFHFFLCVNTRKFRQTLT
jgi:hypothetical protein